MGFAQDVLARRRGGAAVEKRAEWGSSAIPSPLAAGGGGSFATVNLASMESNFQMIAIWSAIDLICSVASQLPIDTFKKQGDGSSKNVGNPKVIEDPAGDGYGAADWVYQYLLSKLGSGNVVGRQTFDASTGYPVQTVLYHPDTVRGERDRVTGRRRWWIDGKEEPNPDNVWHKRSYPVPGCLMGMSPLRTHMTNIQLGIASTRFGAQFFSDSAIPSALLTNEEAEIDQPQATEVKARWMSAIWGTREPAVFGKGWKYSPISLNPDESQFLETNKYSQAQCARIYGPNVAEILGYETGGTMTYSNQVERSMDFLKYTLNRWLRDVENVMTAWLPRGQFVKLNRKALLETDLLGRFKAYQLAIASKFMAPSEAREKEDWAPLTDEQREEIATTTPDTLPADGGEADDKAARHLPGKHDQSTHGRRGGVRASLNKAKTTDEIANVISKEASAIVGDHVAVDMTGADPVVARQFGEGILQGFEKYPAAPLREVGTYAPGGGGTDIHNSRISANSPHVRHATAFAVRGSESNGLGEHYTTPTAKLPNGTHTSGTAVYLNVGVATKAHFDSYARTHEMYASGALAGRAGNVARTPRGVALHEFGHAIAKHGRPGVPEDEVGALARWRAHQAGTDVGSFVRNGVSHYATTNDAELTAEIFADVMHNGKKASKQSKELFDEMNVHLKGWHDWVMS